MKIKRVKDQALKARSSHNMIEGVEGKIIIVHGLEFSPRIETGASDFGGASQDNVFLSISKKVDGSTVLAIGAYSIERAPTPLYIFSDERLVISSSGSNSRAKNLTYMLIYEEVENA